MTTKTSRRNSNIAPSYTHGIAIMLYGFIRKAEEGEKKQSTDNP